MKVASLNMLWLSAVLLIPLGSSCSSVYSGSSRYRNTNVIVKDIVDCYMRKEVLESALSGYPGADARREGRELQSLFSRDIQGKLDVIFKYEENRNTVLARASSANCPEYPRILEIYDRLGKSSFPWMYGQLYPYDKIQYLGERCLPSGDLLLEFECDIKARFTVPRITEERMTGLMIRIYLTKSQNRWWIREIESDMSGGFYSIRTLSEAINYYEELLKFEESCGKIIRESRRRVE